ncbi:transglutaminase domain-containing protein [Candidatus Woesearchaeota archaeon]|jgi:transglutaminase-like putative cysteine protease|nr:transglutaminase domain-containing protein [Candidatus Woesearchaeota archaeon]MBT6336107.1 transglutaminase domain-containing protein [Candidatus Woesearchaeota archaeon]MBT7927944.1 transglutaminase domain-containing protein [Candidatus Woesearchaeota archaeon]
MKKRGILLALVLTLLILLVCLPNTLCSKTEYDNWQNTADSLLLDFELTTDLNVEEESSDAFVKEMTLELSFFPRNDYRQTLVSFLVTPTNYEKGQELMFNWKNPEKKKHIISINSNIRTINMPKKITEKVTFPIKNIPEEYKLYLEETELMDYSDEAIIELATELAEGENDVYATLFKAATWTQENVVYSLNTLTAEASLPASWVLSHRQGVCDELTNLFISIARALDIPAKFVAGISYTESDQFPEKWGAHGWAEVYIPGYAWVPFDVTYGQFGYVDPTHIKLKESYDSDKTSSSFEWLGYKVKVNSEGLDLGAEILDYGSKMPEKVTITNTLWGDKVDIGSYNLLLTKVKNLEDYYLPLTIHISKVHTLNGITPLETIDENKKFILLKPGEEREIVWRLKVSEKLSASNLYTFPILIYTDFGEQATITLEAKKGEKSLSYDNMQKLYHSLQENEEKEYSKQIEMVCTPNNKQYYLGEEVIIKCDLKNKGNVNINELNVCSDSDCKKIELRISQERSVSFAKKDLEAQQYELIISAESNEITKTSKASFIVEEFPKLKIDDITYPKIAKFSEPLDIGFTVVKKSLSTPKNVIAKLTYDFGFENWEITDMQENNRFEITIPANQLTSNINKFKIGIEYYDQEEKKYIETTEFIINIEKLTFKEKIILYINKVNSNPTLAFGIIAVLVVLITIIIFIKKSSKHTKHKK